jgi:hypothetical protein
MAQRAIKQGWSSSQLNAAIKQQAARDKTAINRADRRANFYGGQESAGRGYSLQ